MPFPPASAADYHQVLIKSGYEDKVLLKAQQMDNPAWDLGDPLVIRGNPTNFDSYQKRNTYTNGADTDHVNKRTARFETNSEVETPPRRRQLIGQVWDVHIPFDPNFDTWEQIKSQLVDEGNRMSAVASFARQRDLQVFRALKNTAVEIDTNQQTTQTIAFGETVDGTVDADLTVGFDIGDANSGATVSKIIALNAALDKYNVQNDRSLLMHSISYNQLFEEARATNQDFMMAATLQMGRIPNIMGANIVVSNENILEADLVAAGRDGYYMYMLANRRAFRSGEAGTLRVKLHQDEDRGDMLILSHYWVFEAVRAHEEDVARAICEDTATANP